MTTDLVTDTKSFKLSQIQSYTSNSSCPSLQQSSTTSCSTPEPVGDISGYCSYKSKTTSKSINIDNTLRTDNTLRNHGYKQIRKLCDCSQGEIILASKNTNKIKYAVKKIDNKKYQDKITTDQDGMNYIVQEDVVKVINFLYNNICFMFQSFFISSKCISA